jgi:two-component system sensor histidine kinase QseC
MNSIRRFLVVVLLATITLINFMAALHGYRTSMAEAEQLFDEQLADIADVLAVTATGPAIPVSSEANDNNIAFQVWHDGLLETASAKAPTEAIAKFAAGYSDVNFGGYRWRAFSRYVAESNRWLIVAERADIRFKLADSIILESVLPIIFGLPLVGLLIWFIVGHGLRPLGDLAEEMSNKRSDDLSPVTEGEPPRELAVLINSINDLLRRLDASFER